jgi:macrodomain Ter protein organizer (MatP/YcbG family)
MLSRVALNNWKGIVRVYDLSPATLLVGRNGAGKSACLDAVAYCLSGAIAGGRSNDHVARWFGECGGFVELFDSAGHFLRRGVRVDAAKAKISSIYETDLLGADGKPDFAYWAAPEQVLDVRSFLSLSGRARRDYMLALCGGGVVGTGEIETVALHYAKAIAGPIATTETLTRTDLPADVAPAALAWARSRGIREVLDTCVKGSRDETSSALMLRMGERAKEERLACARDARDARQAINELSDAAHGAANASAEYETRRGEVLRLRAELDARRQHNARVGEATRVVAELEILMPKLATSNEQAKALAAELPALGEKPTLGYAVPIDHEHVIEGLYAERESLCRADEDYHEKSGRTVGLGCRMDKIKENIAKLIDSPAALAIKVLGEIPNDVHPRMVELRALVTCMTEWVRDELALGEASLSSVAAEHEGAIRWISEHHQQQVAHRERIDAIDDEIRALRQKSKSDAELAASERKAIVAELAVWVELEKRHEFAARTLLSTAGAVTQAEMRLASAHARIQELGPRRPPEDLEIALAKAEIAAEAARKAQASVAAHTDAVARCEAQAAMEGHWKIAEEAIRAAKAHLVLAAAAPLVVEIDEVLKLLGREERAWVALENERGTAVCELGWGRGDIRATVESLSAGESVIFLAALTAAISTRTAGIRPLLIEADPLDHTNLECVLEALPQLAARFDAIVLATAQPVLRWTGWSRIDL